jgi:hypothetical protein
MTVANFQFQFDNNFSEQEKMVLTNYLSYLSGFSEDLLKEMIYKSTFEEPYSIRFKNWLYGDERTPDTEIAKLAKDACSKFKSIDYFNSWDRISVASGRFGGVIDFSDGFEDNAEQKYLSIVSSFERLLPGDEANNSKSTFTYLASHNSFHPLVKQSFKQLLISGEVKPFVDDVIKSLNVSEEDELVELNSIASHLKMAIEDTGLYPKNAQISIEAGSSIFTEQEQHVLNNIERYIDSRPYIGNSKPLFERVIKRTEIDVEFTEKFKDWLYGKTEASTVQIRELCREVWNEISPAPPLQGELNFLNAWSSLDNGMYIYGGAIEFTGDLIANDEKAYLDLTTALRELPESSANKESYKLFCDYSSRCQQYPQLKSSLHTLLSEQDAEQFSECLLSVFHVEEYQREEFNKMVEVVGQTVNEMNAYPCSFNPN